MTCPRCQARNREGVSFCEQCGVRLGPACSRCGAFVAPEARFCGACGSAVPGGLSERFAVPRAYTPAHLAERILTERTTLEGERKQVTVLFCDLVGSTALAEGVGPEAMHALLSGFFELALAEVHRYRGTINQFLGDGFMALFGAPLAQEDEARRAVLAALGIQRALREGGAARGAALVARMGLNTGIVVVGKIGDSLRMDYTAVGDTTNLAAHLERLAEPGAILMSEATERLVRGYVRAQPVGPLHVKGKAAAVLAYRVLGPGTRRSRLWEPDQRPLSHFVGRERELETLNALLGRVEGGEGQVVGIVAEPGAGKSRLVLELRQRIADKGLALLEGHCQSYGGAIPYLPVIELVRQLCGVAESDSGDEAAEKLRVALVELGLEADARRPCLLHLLGFKDGSEALEAVSPETLKTRTFEILREATLRATRRGPLAVIVEDLHWIDRTSEEYLAFLVDAAGGAPLLCLFTYRPGYRAPWTERSYATQLALPQLSSADSLALVHGVPRAGHLSEGSRRLILAKAEGNPFFLEELARVAVEHGEIGAGLAIPDTIQDVLAARIDRLPETPRRLLQTAAVLGREAPRPLLEAVWTEPGDLDASLRELVRLELLRERVGPEASVYVFKHALIQDVAYASLLEGRRASCHATAGLSLERLHAGRTDQVVELLAHHFGRSADGEKAVDYALLAAGKARRRWANAEALAHFDAALVRLALLPDTDANRARRMDAVIDQAEVKFALGRHAEHVQALEGIRSLVQRVADPRRRAAWHYWTGFLHSLTGGRPEVATAYCREAAAIAEAEGFEDLRAFADCCLAQVHLVSGALREGVEAGERALETFERRDNVWWASRTLWHLSAIANALGQWRRGLGYCERALAHAATVSDLRLRVSALLRTGSTLIQRGEVADGLRRCDEALALSPIPFDAAAARAIRGYGLVKLGRMGDGVSALEEALGWYERSQLRYTRTQFSLWLAEGELRGGNCARARRLLAEAIEVARSLGYRHLEGVGLRLLGQALAVEAPATAAAQLDAALDILEEIGAMNEVAKTLGAQGDLLHGGTAPGAAHLLWAGALRIYEELDTLDEPIRLREALSARGEKGG